MSIKLLVADDSITIQKVIGIIFGGEEYSLTVVDNGKTAIEKAREICPDVLLIDALMPGMTGYEVAEAIRATPALSSKPILILTGSFEPFDEDKARKCGADDFLAKPFESQQIINKVKELSELGIARANSTATPDEPVAPVVPVSPLTTETGLTSSPLTESFTGSAPHQEIATPAPQPATDIWNAFTLEPETTESAPLITAAPVEAVAVAAPAPLPIEPDVFSIVNEESDTSFIQPDELIKPSAQNIGSQWIPVEESTFEFEEDNSSNLASPTDLTQPGPPLSQSFGDISFEDDEPGTAPAVIPNTVAPVIQSTTDFFQAQPEPVDFTFEEPVVPFMSSNTEAHNEVSDLEINPEPSLPPETFVPEPVHAVSTQVIEPSQAVLSEAQLKEALSAASKEVIERIVWEVVPDLAEALIKDAIRKIKEGI